MPSSTLVRLRVCAVTAVAAGLFIASGCSSDDKPASSGNGHNSTVATTTTKPTSGTTHRTVAPPAKLDATTIQTLRAHMVDTIPGYTLQPAGASGTGASSLERAAQDAGGGAGSAGDDERAALSDAGYQAGYKLLFSAPSNREILSFAYRFDTPEGAQQYADRTFQARVHDGGAPSTRTPVGVPGAKVVERSDDDSSSAFVLFTRGRTLVLLATIQPPGTDSVGLLDPIATEQYTRLADY